MATAAASLPRVVIENVSPQIDGGRYPVKRVVGEVVTVGADIFKDGHDLIAARLLFRRNGERRWREIPLEYDFNSDRWNGTFTPEEVGRWQFVVEAWPDVYRTWREELKKRIDGGQDVTGELLEGARLIERSLERLPKPSRRMGRDAATRLSDVDVPLHERLAVAFSEELLTMMYGPMTPADAARSNAVEIVVDRKLAAFSSWYELFPRSQGSRHGAHGTFADTQARLPEIAALGFDVIYLPPIHPVGRIHRKGRNNNPQSQPGDVGSPWAIGSKEGGHTAVHPELGTVEDFQRLVWAAGEHGIAIALDIALQCAPDHPWVQEHPDWFFVRVDGSIRYAENPPKKYEDIYPINFWCDDRENLWNACLEVLLYWVDRGVHIFRVDNPHTKPFAFWEWAIREVQRDHPDVIFLAEAFTRPKRMKSLAKLGFTQSYTYFTWRNSKAELEEYMTELTGEMAEYYRPNFFANTPDILHAYLQTGGRPAFRIRLILAGMLSPIYGIYSGYELCENTALRPGSEEYLNSEKYEIRVRDWNASGNIKADITTINRIRRENPALQQLANLTLLRTESPAIIAFHKHAPGNDIIVVCTTDPHNVQETMVQIPVSSLGLSEHHQYWVEDLLTGARYAWKGSRNYVRFDPAHQVGHVLRLVRS